MVMVSLISHIPTWIQIDTFFNDGTQNKLKRYDQNIFTN